MSQCLESTPNEVFENIVGLLAFTDSCNLRLCSQAIAAKTTQKTFKSYFRSKHVEITESFLREFVNMTQPGKLGPLVEDLVLVRVVHDIASLKDMVAGSKNSVPKGNTKRQKAIETERAYEINIREEREFLKQRQVDYERLHKSGNDVILLSEAFSNIFANNGARQLHSLSLEVVVYRGAPGNHGRKYHPPYSDWKPTWQSTANTFHAVLRSLATSQLPVVRLNLFNDRWSRRCSLAYSEFKNLNLANEGLAASLASLKSLSISLSNRRAEGDETKLIGFAKLLELTNQLEDLEIHYYRFSAASTGSASDQQLDRLLQYVVEMDTPLTLKKVELRNLYVREQTLLAFIQKSDVRKLSLSGIVLISGTFRSIFDFCASEAAGIEELNLEYVVEGEETVYFEGSGVLRLPFNNSRPSSDKLERVGAEVKQNISYFSYQDPDL